MGKELTRLVTLLILLLAGGAGIWLYYNHLSMEAKLAVEQEKNRVLHEVISRLTSERRVAEILVTDQKMVAGVKTTTLLFVEYERGTGAVAGKALPPRTFTIRGENAHIDAMVIKFDAELVGKADPFRGATIGLFTKIYGDATSPDQAAVIDSPGKIPAIYQGADPKISEYEQGLWANFWKLAYDEGERKKQGVRAIVGQGLWEPLRPGVLYTVTLEASGGLNVKREAVKDIYRAAAGGK